MRSRSVQVALTIFCLFSLSFQLFSAVLEEDNRAELAEVNDRQIQKWSKSTAAMINKDYLKKRFGGHTVENKLLSKEGVDTIHLPFGKGKVCPDMKYANQVSAAVCSAFLVGPDLLMTAGHCVIDHKTGGPVKNVCDNFKWVFDYKLSKHQVKKLKSGKLDAIHKVNVRSSSVYSCKEILLGKNIWTTEIYASENETVKDDTPFYYKLPKPARKPIAFDHSKMSDYALIKLDRKVFGRAPLKIRTEGKIGLSERLVMIGHPLGLPTKVTTGGEVVINYQENFFNTDLDGFHGNSGAAVINKATGEIEGIFSRAGEAFIKDKERACFKINPMEYDSDYGYDPEIFLGGVHRITKIEELMQYLKISN